MPDAVESILTFVGFYRHYFSNPAQDLGTHLFSSLTSRVHEDFQTLKLTAGWGIEPAVWGERGCPSSFKVG